MNLSLALALALSLSLALALALPPPQKDEPDAFKELGTGNRIATWLFYVSIFSGFEPKAKS